MATISARKVRIVRSKYNNRCAYCHADLTYARNEGLCIEFTIDHILPRILGGTDDLENLALSCFTCNNDKGILTEEQFRREVRDRIAKYELYIKRMKSFGRGPI